MNNLEEQDRSEHILEAINSEPMMLVPVKLFDALVHGARGRIHHTHKERAEDMSRMSSTQVDSLRNLARDYAWLLQLRRERQLAWHAREHVREQEES